MQVAVGAVYVYLTIDPYTTAYAYQAHAGASGGSVCVSNSKRTLWLTAKEPYSRAPLTAPPPCRTTPARASLSSRACTAAVPLRLTRQMPPREVPQKSPETAKEPYKRALLTPVPAAGAAATADADADGGAWQTVAVEITAEGAEALAAGVARVSREVGLVAERPALKIFLTRQIFLTSPRGRGRGARLARGGAKEPFNRQKSPEIAKES